LQYKHNNSIDEKLLVDQRTTPASRSEYLGFSGSKLAKLPAAWESELTMTFKRTASSASTDATLLQKIIIGPLYLWIKEHQQLGSALAMPQFKINLFVKATVRSPVLP
jgi:hypothetical protein